MKVDSGRKER